MPVSSIQPTVIKLLRSGGKTFILAMTFLAAFLLLPGFNNLGWGKSSELFLTLRLKSFSLFDKFSAKNERKIIFNPCIKISGLDLSKFDIAEILPIIENEKIVSVLSLQIEKNGTALPTDKIIFLNSHSIKELFHIDLSFILISHFKAQSL